jgi:hypothetical protein
MKRDYKAKSARVTPVLRTEIYPNPVEYYLLTLCHLTEQTLRKSL